MKPEELEEEVKKLKRTVRTLSFENLGLQKQINALNGRIESLNEKLGKYRTDAHEEAKELRKRLDKIEKHLS